MILNKLPYYRCNGNTDLIDRAGVDEDDIGLKFSVEFSRDSDGSEEEIMSRLWPSSYEKIIEFTTKTGD